MLPLSLPMSCEDPTDNMIMKEYQELQERLVFFNSSQETETHVDIIME